MQREELADGSSNKKLKQDIPENGSSVDVSPVDVARTTHLEYAPIQVFCGGDQSFVNVDMVVNWGGTAGKGLKIMRLMSVGKEYSYKCRKRVNLKIVRLS